MKPPYPLTYSFGLDFLRQKNGFPFLGEIDWKNALTKYTWTDEFARIGWHFSIVSSGIGPRYFEWTFDCKL